MVNYLRTDNLNSNSNLSNITLFFLIISALQLIVNSYTPAEDFLIDCGSAGKSNPDSDSRVWIGDIGSDFISLIEPQLHRPSVAADSPKSSGSRNLVPYLTARLSHSEFTYSLSVTGGPKFIRLHFYSSSYPDFIGRNSLFSVKAGRYSLLKNFNASLVADSNDNADKVVFREYFLNVEPGQKLNITFIPSLNISEAYAFINGIEVMSLPPYLYYSKPNLLGIKFVSENSEQGIDRNKALETAYRINVGGPMIQPGEDTGMFRFWEDDTRYLQKQHQPANGVPVFSGDVKPRYTDGVPNFTAPDIVYLTARSFGMMNESWKNNYPSWDFEVDSSFNYLVRLHFCEFESRIKKAGDRVFQIIIADSLAEDHADVIMWSGGNLVPVYKDYAVLIPRLEKGNLSIKLQPHPNNMMSVYHDVILNGIEIFKVSDDHGVANKIDHGSSNPLASEKLDEGHKDSDSKKRTIIPLVIGVVSGVILLCVIGFFYFQRRRIIETKVKAEIEAEMLSISGPKASLPPPGLYRYFSIIEIRLATINFDNIFIIGVGGFGNVYKGFIDDGTTPVAIKRYNPNLSGQGAREFQTEIEMLSQLSHPHLVSLIGFCNDENEMILVYDFMARGTLRDHLYGSKNAPLSWKQRLEVCIDAARGLCYLHYGAKHNVIHRDVKTTNILLDEKWVAKISDFGLSKFGPNDISKTHITTLVKGSIGYLDPQYYKSQRLTQKSDVYSFGVVLLEVLCGRPPLLRAVEKPMANIVEWVEKCRSEGLVDQMVDPFLQGKIKEECLDKFVELALSCTLHDGNQRPSMRNVVEGLKFSLQLQESKGDMMSRGNQVERTSEGVLPNSILKDGIDEEWSCMSYSKQE